MSAPSAPVTPGAATASLTDSPDHTITIGQHFGLTTTLTSNGQPLANTPIELLGRPAAGGDWTPIRDITTDASGVAATTAAPQVNLQYAWDYAGDSTHASAMSAVFAANVRQALTAHKSAGHVKAGHAIKVYGIVAPDESNVVVHLQRRAHGVWTSTGLTAEVKDRALPDGTVGYGYVLSYRPSKIGPLKLRVHVPADSLNLAGTSPALQVNVTPFKRPRGRHPRQRVANQRV